MFGSAPNTSAKFTRPRGQRGLQNKGRLSRLRHARAPGPPAGLDSATGGVDAPVSGSLGSAESVRPAAPTDWPALGTCPLTLQLPACSHVAPMYSIVGPTTAWAQASPAPALPPQFRPPRPPRLLPPGGAQQTTPSRPRPGGGGLAGPPRIARGCSGPRRSLPPKTRPTPRTGPPQPPAGGSGELALAPRRATSSRPAWLTPAARSRSSREPAAAAAAAAGAPTGSPSTTCTVGPAPSAPSEAGWPALSATPARDPLRLIQVSAPPGALPHTDPPPWRGALLFAQTRGFAPKNRTSLCAGNDTS
eukprot:SAG22_NODE_62_length_23371_cov_84.500602_11_plen_304_part_00